MRMALIVLATTLWGQESTLSVGDPSWKGIEVRFVTKAEPPGKNARAQLPGAIITDRGRAHHIIEDAAHKRAFGYDLLLEPSGDGTTVQLRIEPLKLSNPRVYTVEPGWTLLELPAYPVIPQVRVGDTVALDLLMNRATGQKITDYLSVGRRVEVAAHDFSLADVELSLHQPRLWVNGRAVDAMANYQGGISGPVVSMYLAGHGRFVLSLVPNEKLGFQKSGATSANTLMFREGSTEYRVDCGGAVAPGPGRYTLYVEHEAGWRPSAGDAGVPFLLEAADKAEQLVRKR